MTKQQPFTAVILAAGMGTRLRSINGEKPKGLLDLGDGPIIRRSLDILFEFGANEVILVTGYQEEQYQQALQGVERVRFVTNPDFHCTGSMHSLALAAEQIKGKMLLVESDLLYERHALAALLDQNEPSCILLSSKTNSGDEVYVYGQEQKVGLISKQWHQNLALEGELVGISLIEQDLLVKMCSFYKTQVAFPSDFHYEDCLSNLSQTLSIPCLRVDGLLWTEIDDPGHYQRAKDKILPAISAKES